MVPTTVVGTAPSSMIVGSGPVSLTVRLTRFRKTFVGSSTVKRDRALLEVDRRWGAAGEPPLERLEALRAVAEREVVAADRGRVDGDVGQVAGGRAGSASMLRLAAAPPE